MGRVHVQVCSLREQMRCDRRWDREFGRSHVPFHIPSLPVATITPRHTIRNPSLTTIKMEWIASEPPSAVGGFELLLISTNEANESYCRPVHTSAASHKKRREMDLCRSIGLY